MATLIATIAIVVDSQILVIGAMVLGPEFGAVAALGVATVRGRFTLLRRAVVPLIAGFVAAIALTTLFALAAKGLRWMTLVDVTGPRTVRTSSTSPTSGRSSWRSKQEQLVPCP